MREIKEIIQKVADDILGSCTNLDVFAVEYGIEYYTLLDGINEAGVVLCETCDWWVEESDTVNGECNECSSLHDDE